MAGGVPRQGRGGEALGEGGKWSGAQGREAGQLGQGVGQGLAEAASGGLGTECLSSCDGRE